MQSSYTARQDPDQTWSVLQDATGMPIRLAGIPQTGLSQIEAELTLDMLLPRKSRASQQDAKTSSAYVLSRAMA